MNNMIVKDNENFDKFILILHEKFEKSYPDTFLKSRTKDKNIYYLANGAMYSWYIIILNSVGRYNLSPKYTQTLEEAMVGDNARYIRFVDDFEKSENWQAFLFENLFVK